jgi:uncharacterized protein (TIGR03437 family)
MSRFIFFSLITGLACSGFAHAAALTCSPAASLPVLHAEGYAERLGDIVITCSGGQAGAAITGNLNLFLSVNDTNRILPDGTLDAMLTVDNSGTPNPSNVNAVLTSPASPAWNGLSFTLSPTGTVTLRISNLRGNATQTSGMFISGYIAFTGGGTVALTNTQLILGAPQTSLFSTSSSVLFCPASGSPLPGAITFANLVAQQTLFNTERVTEGFPAAFAPKSDPSNANADTGTRLIVSYSGFPSVAHLFVPDFIAGSDADTPTAAGDLGVPASGGQYTPGKGELLLARVNGADANGVGGTLVGSAPVSTTKFTSVTELALTGGAGYAVYEVVDANPAVRETAQIPTWLGAVPFSADNTLQTSQTVFLAPVSDAGTASATAPIPRFKAVTPPNDCGILDDCKAGYFPQLFVDTTPIRVTVPVNQTQSFVPAIRNNGSGAMPWTATVQYTTGSNWIRLIGDQGVNNSFFRIDAIPAGLTPGTYQANVVINAGTVGTQTIPVTVTVIPFQPQPLIREITSSAFPYNPGIVADSLVVLWGRDLGGNAVVVTFDSIPADVLYDGQNQINVHVPATVIGHKSNFGWLNATVSVTVDGQTSPPYSAGILDLAPAIFTGGVVNQDGTVNSDSAPAPTGTVVAVYATGLSTSGKITAKIHDRDVPNPDYAGPAPTVPGVQQVNIRIPQDLPTMQTYVYVCGSTAANPGQQVCSPAQKIWLAHQP